MRSQGTLRWGKNILEGVGLYSKPYISVQIPPLVHDAAAGTAEATDGSLTLFLLIQAVLSIVVHVQTILLLS